MTTLTRSHQVFVHAPMESAFDYVSDLTRHPEWSGGLKIEALTPGPIAVGKEYRSQGEVAVQKDRPNTVRVSQYAPPHTFGFIARDPDFGDISHVFTFVSKDNGVLITRTMTVTLNVLLAFLFRFFIYPLIGKPSMDKSMAALKTRVEQLFTTVKP
jgi:polyketide cyclase/dehydrase/lipid transport protein